ncbi:TPA: metallophosphoesterase, partial [Klebsiella pneumoniae]
MTILSNLSIDLTDFSGRILIVSDLYGHFELLLKGLSKLTQSGDEVVVITTGNLFDWGPSPCQLLGAVVYKKFGDRKVHFFTVVGFHELLMTDAITQKY